MSNTGSTTMPRVNTTGGHTSFNAAREKINKYKFVTEIDDPFNEYHLPKPIDIKHLT